MILLYINDTIWLSLTSENIGRVQALPILMKLEFMVIRKFHYAYFTAAG